jgi:GTP 3',8-cyclase
MEDLRIDNHKLIFHPQRVADWLSGQDIYPLMAEISLSGGCNHRCRFCAFDYLGFKAAFLEEGLLLKNLAVMAENGVKSIVLAGEGEPLLHKGVANIIRQGKQFGLDFGMSSNGVLFSEKIADECLPSLSWVRYSVNAGTEKTYQAIHGSREADFSTVITNLKKAVEIKRRNQLKVTLGVQLLLIKENLSEVVLLGKILKDIGVDYYTVKPYSHHPKSINNVGADIDYQAHVDLEEQLNELGSEDFQIYFRKQSMLRREQKKRRYQKCLGLPFWIFIDSRGNVWACSAFLGDEQFCYGNLYEHSFQEIWKGEKRSKVLAYVESMNIDHCRELCRLDEINAYLNQLAHPHPHSNFI